ncbi:EF-hand domain-containing protein [Caenispirillum bisanense]|uniref:EF hand n=1 Tax=Caenispirillum bisanense TaxID=414052 RepID=A0A286G320_9PROT|nr:EF-hand domain-containing protein [Caenispirillum bisanense]SOD89878.1 EF hand [Caenispirillum bisanense]
MPRRLCLSALAFAGAIAGPVAAGAQTDDVWRRMAEGGSITVAEVRANSTRAFRAIDQDRDGIVTGREFAAFPLPAGLGGFADRPELRADLFDRIDLNSDGRIAAAEWEDAVREDVSIADADDDGQVTLEELSQADLGTVILDFFD